MMTARTPWATAIAVGLLVASAVTIPQATDVARRARQHILTFDVRVSKPTVMDVFFDMGTGFQPSRSAQVALAPTGAPESHRLPLGPGAYWAIRFDPFTEDGTFTLQNVRIADRGGRTVTRLSPERFEPSEFLSIDARTQIGLAATALVGHFDPQLSYRFTTPLLLVLSRAELLYWSGIFYLWALLGALVARFGPVTSPHRLPSAADWQPWRAWAAIGGAAAVATLISVHPLLLGYSLATPNNGPSTFVYDRPPFVPGSQDIDIEPGRAADTNATMWVTLPYTRVQREAVLAGEFPWWNRRTEGGVPLWGQGQSRFLDPIHWLGLIEDEALGADLSFVAGRLVFAVGAGLAAWVGSGSIPAAIVIAIAAPFVGVFTERLNDPGYFSIVYVPWILWGYGLLATAATRQAAASASVVVALGTALTMFASPPKEGVLVLCGAHVAGLAALLAPAVGGSLVRSARRVAWALAAIVAAALLTTPHWLVFLETLSGALTVYDGGVIEFGGLAHLASLAVGTLVPSIAPAGINMVIVAALAVAALEWRRILASPLVMGCAVSAVAGLAIATGVVPAEWLVRVPLVPQIHHLGRSTLIAVVPLLLTAASPGVASLWEAARGSSSGRPVAAGVLVTVIVCAAVLIVSDLAQPAADAGLVAAAWAGTWPYLCRAAATGHGGLLGWVALSLVTAALLLPGGLHLPTGLPWMDEVLMQPRQRVALDVRPPEFGIMASDSEPYRVVGTNRVLSGGVPAHLGLETITGFEALASPHGRWLGSQFAQVYPSALPPEPAGRAQGVGPLLDLWGVRYQVAASDTAEGRPLIVKERPSAWPRAFYTDRVEMYDDRLGFADRLRRSTGPLAAVVGGDPEAESATRPFRGHGTVVVRATDYTLTPNTTTFTVHAPGPGVVVLSEAFWPGMTATVNGRPAAVFRVNTAMRGVVIGGQGTWVVTFAYRPRYWSIAAWMAATGAAVIAALAALALRERPRPPRAARPLVPCIAARSGTE